MRMLWLLNTSWLVPNTTFHWTALLSTRLLPAAVMTLLIYLLFTHNVGLILCGMSLGGMRARVKTLGSSMNFNSSRVTNFDPGCTQLLMDLLHMSLSPIAVCEIYRLPFGIWLASVTFGRCSRCTGGES